MQDRLLLTLASLTLAVPVASVAKDQAPSPEVLARDYLAGRSIFTSPPEVSPDGKHASVVGLVGAANPMMRCTVSLDRVESPTEGDALWRVASMACK